MMTRVNLIAKKRCVSCLDVKPVTRFASWGAVSERRSCVRCLYLRNAEYRRDYQWADRP